MFSGRLIRSAPCLESEQYRRWRTITRPIFKLRWISRWQPCFPPLNALRQSSTGPSAPNATCLSLSISRGRSPVQDGFSAAVQVVELLLGHRVVDVHGGHAQFPGFGQLIQPGGKKQEVEAPTLCGCMLLWGRNSPVNASDALLYDTPDLLEHIWVFLVHPVCQVPSVIKDLTGKKRTVEKRCKLLFYKTET